MDKNVKQSTQPTIDENSSTAQCSELSKSDRVIHDAEHGLEENVELVDSEWADFERALRYNAILFNYWDN